MTQAFEIYFSHSTGIQLIYPIGLVRMTVPGSLSDLVTKMCLLDFIYRIASRCSSVNILFV